MWDNKNYLIDMKVSELSLPGTHDTAAYPESKTTAYIDKMIFCQEETIFNQLIYGVRYLDIRYEWQWQHLRKNVSYQHLYFQNW